ncbi:MAG: hypothetical protein WBD16_13880 [Pyrinomonadaceae bacterium]
MSKKFTDENIDQLLQTLVNDAALDDAKIDGIADSPQLWWGVQRKIKADEKPLSIWQAGFFRRWLMLAAPLTVAVLLIVAFFALKPAEKTVEQVLTSPPQNSTETIISNSEDKSDESDSPEIAVTKSFETQKKPANSVKTSATEKKNTRPRQPKTTAAVAKSESAEIKSEFIALSYARNPDSGQIVRVKVPSSMMVSLGLVGSVEKPTNLVNAEILIGDDGMTHAIRFIR